MTAKFFLSPDELGFNFGVDIMVERHFIWTPFGTDFGQQIREKFDEFGHSPDFLVMTLRSPDLSRVIGKRVCFKTEDDAVLARLLLDGEMRESPLKPPINPLGDILRHYVGDE